MPFPQAKLRQHRGEMVAAMELDIKNMHPYCATPQQVREAVLSFRVTASDFADSIPLKPMAEKTRVTQRELEMISELCVEAIEAGRLIDFGFIPNDVIMAGSERGGPMWNAGALGQPFQDPWLMMHTWDGLTEYQGLKVREKGERASAIYLVNPIGDDIIEISEMQPIAFGQQKCLMIADRGFLRQSPNKELANRYECLVAPSPLRWVDNEEAARDINNGDTPEGAAAGNLLDPIMVGLLILNTRNVEREVIEAPAKLQKARAKSGKAPIPPYTRLNTLPYITAWQNRGRSARGEDRGGTHRSPVAHIRMGHPRHYASGRSIFIPDTLVNVPPEQREAFRSNRSHYEVR